MTPEQIRQIAEEYAHRNNSNPNPPYCHEEELTKRLTEAFMAGAQYITERYCVVERSKVEQDYMNFINIFENHPNSIERAMAKSIADELKSLFGSETFNKKEDD